MKILSKVPRLSPLPRLSSIRTAWLGLLVGLLGMHSSIHSAHAQSTETEAKPAAEKPAKTKKQRAERKAKKQKEAKTQKQARASSVWTATKDGRTLHLAGSIHIADKKMFPLSDAYLDAYDACDVIVFETDLRKLKGMAVQMKMMKQMMFQDGTSLKDHVSKEAYADFKKYCGETGIPPMALSSMKPFMAGTTLALMKLKQAGMDIEGGGVDGHLEQKAVKDKKTIIGLENIDFYTKLFAEFDLKDEVSMFETTMKDFKKTVPQTKELIRHWRSGNAEHLEALLKEGMADMKSIEKKILYDRNDMWMPKLKELHEKHDNVMVVVGAAHLVGKGSVTEMLEKGGFAIEQK